MKISLSLLLLATGCTSPGEYEELRQAANTSVEIEIDPEKARIWSENQLKYLRAFAAPADLPASGNPQWTEIARTGFVYVDNKCDTFLNALDAYADEQRSLRESTGLVGTASATLLGLADAASSAIAAVSGAFTLAQGLMDTSAQTVLFSVSPTSLRELRSKAASAYRSVYLGDLNSDEPAKVQIVSRSQAAEAIGGYAALCTPVALKSLVGKTIDQVQLTASPSTGRVGVQGFTASAPGEQLTPGQDVGRRTPNTGSDALPGAANDLERTFSANTLRIFQQSLCIAEPAPQFGPETRAGVRSLRAALGLEPIESEEFDGGVVKALRSPDLRAPCPDKYINVNERLVLSTDEAVNDFLDRLNAAARRFPITGPPGRDLIAARDAADRVAARCGLPITTGISSAEASLVFDLSEGVSVPNCGL